MTSTTGHFQWVDRDTAARDLLQVAYHAPGYIGEQTWKLLSAIRSPAIIPELKALVLDTNSPFRKVALETISATSGNIYFPEFKAVADDFCNERDVRLLELLRLHPVNTQWLMQYIQDLPPKTKLPLFTTLLWDMPDLASNSLMALLNEHPILLDLFLALHLKQRGNQSAQKWLKDHWDDLIYLCLIDGLDQTRYGPEYHLVWVLEKWPELKQDLFRRCPAIIDKYEEKKALWNAHHLRKENTKVDLQSIPVWRGLETAYHDLQAEGNERAVFLRFGIGSIWADADIPRKAAKTYFFGKFVKESAYAFDRLCVLLQTTYDDWRSRYPDGETMITSPVRYEAASALSQVAVPQVWELLVESFFARPGKYFDGHLEIWIARMTDQLSGVNPTDEVNDWDVNERPWFQVLAEPDPEREAMSAEYESLISENSDAMYAAYYGAEKPVQE